MITINEKASMLTVVNVFTVEPEKQQSLIDFLVEEKEPPMSSLPGLLSFSVHKSLDGKKVLNYIQWSSQEALESAIKSPVFAEDKKQIIKLAKDFNSSPYEVVFTEEAQLVAN
ncbi:conserved hypothetical protein [Hyella patelloides LEGE 07179]|uniref:ABM domain-containing protein n=1 Tax=Hyella patelloides LEGE 07179 TaxID=945734 RepID=A0A563VN44_9CYAN|nr:antibiotic biosynthesis monooxygenase family protein [Hyella patelloides]VEP12876.1 conserved hypothetical protein [Hyella patelloides LEGE 07179]